MENGKIIVWSSLLGFEKTDSDRGVRRFLDQAGFVPEAVCALLYHRAFVQSKTEIDYTRIISKFPVLPPRYVEQATDKLQFIYLTHPRPPHL